MMQELEGMLRAALCERLTHGIEVREIEDGDLRIILPLTSGSGDPLSFVLERGTDVQYLTDDGESYHTVMGVTGIVNPNADIWDKVEETASRYGLDFNAGEINIEVSTVGDIARAITAMWGASAEIAGLAHGLVRPFGVRFEEEIEHFFKESAIPYFARESIIGSSQTPHRVDFLLTNSRDLVAQAVASEQTMRRALNIFYDLTEKSREYIPIAFVDDARSGYSSKTFAQLSYKSNVFMWRERGRFLDYWHSAHQPTRERATLPIPGTE